MIKTIAISKDKSIQIDTANVNSTDVIIITIDSDVLDIDIAQKITEQLKQIFPTNKIFVKLIGIDINFEASNEKKNII